MGRVGDPFLIRLGSIEDVNGGAIAGPSVFTALSVLCIYTRYGYRCSTYISGCDAHFMDILCTCKIYSVLIMAPILTVV